MALPACCRQIVEELRGSHEADGCRCLCGRQWTVRAAAKERATIAMRARDRKAEVAKYYQDHKAEILAKHKAAYERRK